MERRKPSVSLKSRTLICAKQKQIEFLLIRFLFRYDSLGRASRVIERWSKGSSYLVVVALLHNHPTRIRLCYARI